jgi:Flp pilus assembly pilin Flp
MYLLALIAHNAVVGKLSLWLEQRSRGQSTVEYALVGAVVVLAAAAALTALGGQIAAVFQHMTSALHPGT